MNRHNFTALTQRPDDKIRKMIDIRFPKKETVVGFSDILPNEVYTTTWKRIANPFKISTYCVKGDAFPPKVKV